MAAARLVNVLKYVLSVGGYLFAAGLLQNGWAKYWPPFDPALRLGWVQASLSPVRGGLELTMCGSGRGGLEVRARDLGEVFLCQMFSEKKMSMKFQARGPRCDRGFIFNT